MKHQAKILNISKILLTTLMTLFLINPKICGIKKELTFKEKQELLQKNLGKPKTPDDKKKQPEKQIVHAEPADPLTEKIAQLTESLNELKAKYTLLTQELTKVKKIIAGEIEPEPVVDAQPAPGEDDLLPPPDDLEEALKTFEKEKKKTRTITEDQPVESGEQETGPEKKDIKTQGQAMAPGLGTDALAEAIRKLKKKSN